MIDKRIRNTLKDYTFVNAKDGRCKMWELFGDTMNTIIDELNEVLAA